MTIEQILERLLSDTPLSKDARRLLLGLPPVPKFTCRLVSGPNGERLPCCDSHRAA